MGWRENTHRENVRWFVYMAVFLVIAYIWTYPALLLILAAILMAVAWLNRRFP